MSIAVQKHPLAVAWEEWLESPEGLSCRDESTLTADLPGRAYLRNRLYRAFMAGAAVRSNGEAKKPRSYVKLDGDSRESKILAVLDKTLRNRTSSAVAMSTAQLDSELRHAGFTVMSISTRLSRLRTTWAAMGVGRLRRFDQRIDGKRICYYFLEKASA